MTYRPKVKKSVRGNLTMLSYCDTLNQEFQDWLEKELREADRRMAELLESLNAKQESDMKEYTIVLCVRSSTSGRELKRRLRPGVEVCVDGLPICTVLQRLAVDVPESQKLLGRVVAKRTRALR